jgi:hypothetical protein
MHGNLEAPHEINTPTTRASMGDWNNLQARCQCRQLRESLKQQGKGGPMPLHQATEATMGDFELLEVIPDAKLLGPARQLATFEQAPMEMTLHDRTRIIIEPTTLGDRGQRYRVKWAGGTLIEYTRNPEHDACRALLARGITGRLEVWRAGAELPASSIDIERGAQWTISETGEHGPLLVRWKRFEDHDRDAVSRCDGWENDGRRAAVDRVTTVRCSAEI